MGRRRIEINREDIEEVLKGSTLTEGALKLGVSRSTLVKRIGELGIGKGRGNYKRKYRRRKKHSQVHRKLVERSGTVLPDDPVALSRILKTTPEQVRSYLERGRKSSERFIKEILKKAPKDLVLKDWQGNRVPIASVARMSVMLDRWGRHVSIVVTSKQGVQSLLKYKMRDLWTLLENE